MYQLRVRIHAILASTNARKWRGLVKSASIMMFSFVLFFCALDAAPQSFPERPVTLIVPFPAGGSTDVALRTLAEATSKHLGQRIVIENRSGAGGTIGPAWMARNARPDGYTVSQLPITVFRM